ncbi:MAG TPA: hypothetical protein VK586_02225, partial [Streptosporangiaceae bacterium]|nr:hypothetical protein [Streptosporangiaceae bacterium]
MSSPTERAAAGGGAAARPESPAGQPPTAPDAARPEPAPGGSGQVAAERGAPDSGVADPEAAVPEAAVPEAAGHPGHEGASPLFLRAGRAGLAPEAVTVVGRGEDTLASLPLSARPDVAGLPPWADELPGPEPHTLPPWEAGPWPSYELPARDPGGPDDRHDNGQPGTSAPRADRPADPFAGHFADTGHFADISPFTDPASRPPAGDSAAAAPAGSSPAGSNL